MAQQHSKISKAKARLLQQHPFFATLLLRTPVIITDVTEHGQPIETAATNGEKHYFNPQFLDACSVEEVMTVLAHEAGHDSLLHSIRLGGRNPGLWNEAGDHAINIMLEDQGFKPPKCGWLCDKTQFKGWSADRIYDDLRRKQKDKKPPKGGQGQGQGQGQGKPGGGQPQPGQGQGAPGDQPYLQGDVLPSPAGNDPAAQAAAEQRAKQKVAAAATAARLAGKLTGDLERMVGEFLNPKVHWTEVLRDYLTRVVKAKDNWSRRNRRYGSVYLPTRRSHQMGPIVFIPDTSGSMMGPDMEQICSEMSHCAMQTQPENIRVVWTDAVVKGEQVFDNPADFEFAALKPVGGGGTDMRCGLKHAEQYDPQVAILLTDGYTPWPAEPTPYPVICIMTTSQKCPDWMERIEI